MQELIKANDHIAFLSRLTNNKTMVFGPNFTGHNDRGHSRGQEDLYFDKNSLYGSKDLIGTSPGSKFPYQTMSPGGERPNTEEGSHRANMQGSSRKETDNSSQKDEINLMIRDQLSENFQKATDEQKKLPEVPNNFVFDH